MKWRLLLGVVFLASGPVWGDDKAPAKETKALCPVSGQPVDMSVSADYHGGKVYFCCGGCTGKFDADKEKYATKANLQLVVTGQAKQVACPLTGKATNPEKTLDVDGVKVAFCCGGCQGKVSKAKAGEQLEMCFGKGFDKAFKVAAKEEKKE